MFIWLFKGREYAVNDCKIAHKLQRIKFFRLWMQIVRIIGLADQRFRRRACSSSAACVQTVQPAGLNM